MTQSSMPQSEQQQKRESNNEKRDSKQAERKSRIARLRLSSKWLSGAIVCPHSCPKRVVLRSCFPTLLRISRWRIGAIGVYGQIGNNNANDNIHTIVNDRGRLSTCHRQAAMQLHRDHRQSVPGQLHQHHTPKVAAALLRISIPCHEADA